MAVTFDAELIYKCTFYSLKKNKIEKKDILRFCNKLNIEVSELAKENLEYKYINMELSKEDISDLYEKNFGKITEIGDTIYYSGNIEDIDIAELTEHYSNNIINILDKIIKGEE